MNDLTQSPQARASRRRAIRKMAAFLAASPLVSIVDANGRSRRHRTGPAADRQPVGGQGARPVDPPGVVRPPAYRDEIMKVVNLHEFEDAAKKSLSVAAYDYVAAGAGDELTLRANREAYSHYWIRRKVMVDVSKIDTSLELLGQSSRASDSARAGRGQEHRRGQRRSPGGTGGTAVEGADGRRSGRDARRDGQERNRAHSGGAPRWVKARRPQRWRPRSAPKAPARRRCA